MNRLKGARELRARLKAIKQTFKPAGREWADEAVLIGKAIIRRRTGKTAASIRRKNSTQRRATVAARHVAFFIDKGTVAHTIRPRRARHLVFRTGGRTVFSKRVNHPRTSAHPFRERMAREALRRKPMAVTLIALWNRAA